VQDLQILIDAESFLAAPGTTLPQVPPLAPVPSPQAD
jgi:hypothetical protein